MSFRSRILLGFGLVVLVPLVVFGLRVRAEMAGRLTAEYERRVHSLVAVIRADLEQQSAGIAGRLGGLREAVATDNRFRRAALEGGDGTERPYLLDYAGDAMRLAGLSLLQIQDGQGRIISSGHFRNEYDRLEPELPRLLAAAPGGMALVESRTAEAPLLALARVDSLRLAGRPFTLVGGVAVDSGFLARLAPDPELAVSVALPSDTLVPGGPSGQGQLVSALTLPVVMRDSAKLALARIIVTHSLAPLRELRRRVDLAFLTAVLASGAITLLLAGWMSFRISRPLSELARRTSQIDMDRLDVSFASDRDDEIGSLTRLLAAMTDRLRAGAARMREAERRIAVGDLARQVNHDIKNGLIPIRNVFRHLVEAAGESPERLLTALRDRQGTVESSISYLEHLAGRYARLSPEPAGTACDVNAVVREALRRIGDRAGVELRTELARTLPRARADALVVRRILENLVGNALDAVRAGEGGGGGGAGGGTVTVSTERGGATDGAPTVRLTVTDTGTGMTRAELERAFDDFYTTKPGGTGLGLSIVRRLVLDAGGSLRVETQPGAGSRFIVELPAEAGEVSP